jgi:hypothetical protein
MSGKSGEMEGDDAPRPKEEGVVVVLEPNSADAARAVTEQLSVLSVAESDTFLRKYAVRGAERKANLDLNVGGKSRFRRRKADARDADLDGFDYKGPAKEVVKKKFIQPISDGQDLYQQRKDSRTVALSAPRGEGGGNRRSNVAGSEASRRPSNEGMMQRRMSSDGTGGQEGSHHSGKDDFDSFGQRRSQRKDQRFSDDASHVAESVSGHSSTQRKKSSNFFDDASLTSESRSLTSTNRVQVNIALNEDLSCSYKLSQLSSCNVEGVVQVSFANCVVSARTPFCL